MCDTPKNHNFNSQGRELPHPAGYYLIPRDRFADVVAQMQWDKSVLKCFRFVPRDALGRCAIPSTRTGRRR
jgi:hypothetical protein